MPLHNSVDEKYEYIHYNKSSHKKGQVVVLNFLQKLRMHLSPQSIGMTRVYTSFQMLFIVNEVILLCEKKLLHFYMHKKKNIEGCRDGNARN